MRFVCLQVETATHCPVPLQQQPVQQQHGRHHHHQQEPQQQHSVVAQAGAQHAVADVKAQ
jgi:hypothetical protein